MIFKDNPVVYLWRKMWRYSKGNRNRVGIYSVFFVLANLIEFCEPLLVAKILNTIQKEGVTSDNLPHLSMLLGVFLLITFGFWMFHGPARVMEDSNAFLADIRYKKYLLDGTMALPAQWHTDHHSGDTIDKIRKGTDGLYDFSKDTFIIIESVIRLLSSFLALAYFNLYGAGLVLFFFIITISVIIRFDRILVKKWGELYGLENKVAERIFDVLSNITTVIILRIEKLVSKSIYQRMRAPYDLQVNARKMEEVKWFIVSVGSSLAMIGVLFSYFFVSIKTGSIVLVGTVYALYGYVARINDISFRFAYKYSEIVRQRTKVSNVQKISNEFIKKTKNKSINLGDNWKELVIKNLTFSYHSDEGADVHLDNVSFSIGKGQKIAFIGESGSGKTTTLKVIRELYTPKSVMVSLDGDELEGGLRSISSNISLIPQDPEIFATTIIDNITLGVDRAKSEIDRFVELAKFSDVVKRLPNGYDSSIVEKGVNLSGGEKQRLALARGLLASKDKSIILLDEPTSSVDTKNELEIYNNIFREFQDKAVVSSIHRLHLLRLFDVIYLFGNGKILASGSFDDLLEHSQEFQLMWERYSKAHKEE